VGDNQKKVVPRMEVYEGDGSWMWVANELVKLTADRKGTVSTDYKENLRWGNTMKLMQTIGGIVLISVILLSVTAIAAPANNITMYDTTMYDTKTITSIPEVVASNLIAAFTATHAQINH
jgi:hypothetical protein